MIKIKYFSISLLLGLAPYFTMGMEVGESENAEAKRAKRKAPSLFYLSRKQVIKNAKSQPAEVTDIQMQFLPRKLRQNIKNVVSERITNLGTTRFLRSDVKGALEMLALGADPEQCNKFGDSLLLWTLKRKAETARAFLLTKEIPINVNHKNIYGAGALDLVEKVEPKALRDEITSLLTKRGIQRDFFHSVSSGYQKSKDFLSTVIGGDTSNLEDDIFQKVFEARIDFTVEDYQNYIQMLPEKTKIVLPTVVKKPLNPAGMTWLHYATTAEDVEKLFILGADINAETKFKETPLHTMLQGGCYGAALRLIKNVSRDSGYCNSVDDYHMTPLCYGVLTGNRNVIKQLIKKGADPYYGYFSDKKDNKVLAPVFFLALINNKEIVETLLNRDFVNTLDPNIRLEALTKALEKNRNFLFNRLTQDGNFLNTFYDTRIGHVNLLMHLLHEQKTKSFWKLMLRPSYRSALDVDAKNRNGRTPLMFAGKCCPHTVRALLELGASVNTIDDDGNTALHYIVSENNFREDDSKDNSFNENDKSVIAMRFLLEKGASIDAQNNEGNTALHIATQRNWGDTIKFLVEKGASLTLQNKKGYKPYEIHKYSFEDSYSSYLEPK